MNSVAIAAFALAASVGGAAQTPSAVKAYPAHVPYAFSNFVWWSDSELRTALKQRIKGLGDEISPDGPSLDRIRVSLEALLAQKGIHANVFSIEPPVSAFSNARDPRAPEPAIIYSILSPKILVDRVVVLEAPDTIRDEILDDLHSSEGKDYSGQENWFLRLKAEEILNAFGYLDSKVDIEHDAPRKTGDHYLVNMLATVSTGPQYRVRSLSADGGPLLRGQDLSQYFSERVGDIAGGRPFRDLESQIRVLYQHHGFADVSIQDLLQLDREHATASYQLTVSPGPLYHVRNLTIKNLSAEQEARVRDLLGMKSGDVYDQENFNNLYRSIPSEPALSPYRFSYTVTPDKDAAVMDLTLDFYKASEPVKATVK